MTLDVHHFEGLSATQLDELAPLTAGLPIEGQIRAAREAERAAEVVARDRQIDELVSPILEERSNWLEQWQSLEDLAHRDDPTSRMVSDAALDRLIARCNLNGCALLGYVLRYGVGGRTRDGARAFDLFSRAARGGHVVATYHVGDCYQHGIGTEADIFQAIHWYQRGVGLCCLEAIAALAMLYRQGYGGVGAAQQLTELHWHLATFYKNSLSSHPGGRGMRRQAYRMLMAYIDRYGAETP